MSDDVWNALRLSLGVGRVLSICEYSLLKHGQIVGSTYTTTAAVEDRIVDHSYRVLHLGQSVRSIILKETGTVRDPKKKQLQ